MIKREIGVLRELMEKSEGDRDARERQQQEERVKKRWICWWLVVEAEVERTQMITTMRQVFDYRPV